MIDFSDLKDRIAKYRVTNDADMPWAYQRVNPQGRPLHNDWGIWPLTRIPCLLNR